MSEKTFKIVNGDMSDGYHTFDELYEHRCLLFLMALKGVEIENQYWVADHFEGWDLLVANLDGKQVSYHLPVKYRPFYEYGIFERNKDEHQWDGHAPTDVIERLKSFLSPQAQND